MTSVCSRKPGDRPAWLTDEQPVLDEVRNQADDDDVQAILVERVRLQPTIVVSLNPSGSPEDGKHFRYVSHINKMGHLVNL